MINTLLTRHREVPPVFQTRKCLEKRSATRTCAATRELKKSRTDFFNTLLVIAGDRVYLVDRSGANAERKGGGP